jgi:mRNA interferase RelE/StbE
MKALEFSRRFKKSYKKLPQNIQEKADRKLRILAESPSHPSLQTKKMINQDDIWEARIDFHFRMTFEVYENIIVLRTIGTHEIYRNP